MIKSIRLPKYIEFNEYITIARQQCEKIIENFEVDKKEWDKVLLLHESKVIRSMYLDYLELWIMEQEIEEIEIE